MKCSEVYVIKKDGTRESFQPEKIIKAVEKSAYRALSPLTEDDKYGILEYVEDYIQDYNRYEITVPQMHNLVESALECIKPEIAKSYRDYRNYKTDFVEMINSIFKKAQSIMYIGDKENSNTDSSLVSTKRSLIFNQLNKELYQKFFMTRDELQACRDGYIYIHDMSSRRDTFNCSISDVKSILSGGFEMGNVWYNEPKTLDTAFDVMGDIVLSAASQQYGGYTISRVDEILSKYAKLSYDKYMKEEKESYLNITNKSEEELTEDELSKFEEIVDKKIYRDYEQGFQGWEYKFNTVSSSRGDYPFTTITIGLGTDKYAKMATTVCLRVRAKGQGAEGKKRIVLFPKVVFTYTEDLHGEGKINEDLFWEGVKCSSKAMYPDWLSLDGDTTIAKMYHKYNEVIAPMGCVSGDSEIYVKIDSLTDPVYSDYITMKELWTKLEEGNINHGGIKQQPAGEDYLYCDPEGVEVYDIRKADFVKITRVVRNKTSLWKKIVLSGEGNEYTVQCTYDHPFPVLDEDGDKRIPASSLKEGQRIRVEKPKNSDKEYAVDMINHSGENVVPDVIEATIVTIENVEEDGYSYDVTTESDHFTVNHIDSHNCRAFLSPYYERGGFEPADEDDKPIFTGRWNGGVVSLHLPLILAKSRKENKDFYEVLDYYLEMIRNLHKRTRDYIGELRASTNPLEFCEGGFYGGHLQPRDKIKPLMDYVTFSYGITALNELNRLYNGKSIKEDGEFPLEVMKYINKKIKEYKKEDHILYAIYGSPAESLCLSGDTLVKTIDGNKPIKDIIVGDMVYSFNEKECKDELKKVTFSGKTGENREVVKIIFDNDEEIICTPDHEIAVINNDCISWVEAKDLKENDVTYSYTKENDIKVKSVEFLAEKIDVYDITVEDNHNFFVGNGKGILVHNCGTQIQQFRQLYGIVENVSDREYVSNSFHCHVSEDISPIEKQDKEYRFWNLFEGGRIQYVKYPINYNYEAIATLVRRAMKMGLYEGINLSLAYCNNCGHEELEMDVCPKCGSSDLVQIQRMNGYLSYSRVHGDSRLNDAKMHEIKDRVSM